MKKLIVMMVVLPLFLCAQPPTHGIEDKITADNIICISDSSIIVRGDMGVVVSPKLFHSHGEVRDYAISIKAPMYIDVPKGSRLLIKFSNDSISEEESMRDAKGYQEIIYDIELNKVTPWYVLSNETKDNLINNDIVKMRMEIGGSFLDIHPSKADSKYIRESFDYLRSQAENTPKFYDNF